MSITRKWIPSPNYSSRGGAKVRLIVVHTAEGATNIEDLGNFFKSASAGVSRILVQTTRRILLANMLNGVIKLDGG
jgi:hypothetical protein